MNRLLLSLSLLVFMTVSLMGQTKISGIVKDSSTEKEIYNLNVLMVETGEEVNTDRIGYFQFMDVKPGNYTLRITGVGYESIDTEVTVTDEQHIDLGDIFVVYDPTQIEVGLITLTSDELDADETSSQSGAGLLQSSKDVFDRTAAFELGAYWFKVRGYDNKYNDVFFNGVRMNKISNNRVNFGDWGGLNDVTRYPYEQTNGINPSEFAFGHAAGVTYFDTRPSQMRKGTSLAYSFTNRSYNQRVLATYNTGLNKKGWGFMFSGARRWAQEGVIDGTFYDSWAYFLGVEKKINNRHTLNLTAFGAPTRRATNSPNTAEVYELMGKNYNSYWGWYDGKKRSERIRKFHQPIVMLTHHWNLGAKSKLTSTVSYQFGKDQRSRLDWFKAENPSPTYYRNLPSWFRSQEIPDEGDILNATHRWQNDQSYSQINWNQLYFQNANRNELGLPAAYILAGDVIAENIFTFSTLFKSEINERMKYNIGLSHQNTNSHAYREALDMLGGEYFLNYNDFQQVHYNMDELGENGEMRHVGKGDKYQYDYNIHHNKTDLFTQFDMDFGRWDLTVGAKLAYTSVYRDGKYRHEQYMNRSKGKSETYNFVDYGLKSRILFKIDGRNFIQLNSLYATYAPTVDEIFPNARSNDFTIDNYEYTLLGSQYEVKDAGNLTSTKLFSTDISYVLRSQRIKGRVTGFYSLFKDEYKKNFGYIDEASDQFSGTNSANLFGAEYLYNVDKQFIGGELAVEAQLSTTLTLSAVASLGQYTYNNNPTYQRFSDSNFIEGTPDESGTMTTVGATFPQIAYMKNFKLSEGPQQGFSLGLEYRDPRYWWVGATVNYLGASYIDVAPFRRTQGFLTHWTANGYEPYPQASDQELVRELLAQEKFSNEFMLNLNAGKTFRMGKYFMGISANVNNVLNNRNYVTGGFEQLRIGNLPEAANPHNQVMFGPKYWYDRGISYFLNVFFRF